MVIKTFCSVTYDFKHLSHIHWIRWNKIQFAIIHLKFPGFTDNSSIKLRRGAAVSVVTSGSEEREFEPHSGSGEVSLFPPSVYHHYGDSYDRGRINL